MHKLILAATLFCASAFAAGPAMELQVHHDIIAYHLAQGKTPDEICSVVELYFDVRCGVQGSDIILFRGGGTEMSYFSIFHMDAKE